MATARCLYHWLLALIGKVFYGTPSRHLFVVGVTGTKGKSTTIEVISHILEVAGRSTALLSSIRRKIRSVSEPNLTGNTMPGRFAIQRFLRDAARERCEFALVEVTSEGIVQHRHRFVDWDTAICTNLAPEHIESHGSFERYRDAKVSFFEYAARSRKPRTLFLVNEEDPYHTYFEDAVRGRPGTRIQHFSREHLVKEAFGRGRRSAQTGKRHLDGWLRADFNMENAAAAVAFAREQHVAHDVIMKALASFPGVAGRLEYIQEKPFEVVVDYAHTPDSLEKVYQVLRPRRPTHRMICVLGSCGGGRDRWKRPVMGKIAVTYCDRVVVTNEDPYDEDPIEIMRQVENGFLEATAPRAKPADCFRIPDRRAAIQKAISLARRGDTVVITGKGSEPWIRLAKGEKVPWSDRRVAEEGLRTP